jgi:hypothetical protein
MLAPGPPIPGGNKVEPLPALPVLFEVVVERFATDGGFAPPPQPAAAATNRIDREASAGVRIMREQESGWL